MKNKSKNFFFFIFFICLLSACSSNKKSIFEVDLEDLKKEGKEYFIDNDIKKNNNKKTNFKSSIKLSNSISINNWTQSQFNSLNETPHISFSLKNNLNKKKTSKYRVNIKSKNYSNRILYFKEKIIFIDDASTIYIFDDNLNLINLKQIYSKNILKNISPDYSLAVSDNYVFVSDSLGGLHAYDYEKKRIVWQNNLAVPFRSNLIFYNKILYVTNSNGKLFAFDSLSGEQIWSLETGTSNIKKNNAFRIAINNNKLVFSNDLSDLYCVDLNKKSIIWTQNLLKSTISGSQFFFEMSPLVINDNNIFLSTSYGDLMSFNINNGNLNWQQNFTTSLIPIINNNNLILLNKTGEFSIFEKFTGKLIFSSLLFDLKNKDNKENIDFKDVFLVDNKIYFLSYNGILFYLETDNLKIIKYNQLSSEPVISMRFLDNFLIYINKTGHIVKIFNDK